MTYQRSPPLAKSVDISAHAGNLRGPVARRDPDDIDQELVALIREASGRAGRSGAGDAEIRAALLPLSPAEEKALRRAAVAAPRARPLGPFGWADIARGVDPEIAAARELSGYYTLQAERDALAAMVGAGSQRTEPAARPQMNADAKTEANGSGDAAAGIDDGVAAERAPSSARAPRNAAPPRRPEAKRAQASQDEGAGAKRGRAKTDQARQGRIDELLGLFTYHRDAPRVARSLGMSLAELEAELDALKIRRKAFRLTRGTDFDLPLARANPSAPSGPSVRRRTRGAPAAARPAAKPAEPDRDAEQLKKLLAAVGPRREVLKDRLGTRDAALSDAALLARFRAAGLERELSFRERDLIKGLYMKYRGSERRIAAELRTTIDRLHEVVRERGLKREIDRLVDGYRREVRNRRWPKDRIEQVLKRRDYLTDLGVYDELEREVVARSRVLWEELRGKPRALDELRRALDLTRPDAEKLQKLAQLR
jgi:hypothetical protein